MGTRNRIGRQGFVSEADSSSSLVLEGIAGSTTARSTVGIAPDGSVVATAGGAVVVYAPFKTNPSPPVYTSWSAIEDIVNANSGAVTLMIDHTDSVTVPPYCHAPSTANLDGQGRLSIVGVGSRGEAGLIIDDGGQIKNVQSWKTIVVRTIPTIRPSIVYDLRGMVVTCFDTTFYFGGGGTATKPHINVATTSPSNYLIMYLNNAGFSNFSSPYQAVLNVEAAGQLILAVGPNMFGSGIDNTIAGTVASTLQLQLDASQPNVTLPSFSGSITTNRVDAAGNISYTAASSANWNSSAPTTVKDALDRIAAKIGPVS